MTLSRRWVYKERGKKYLKTGVVLGMAALTCALVANGAHLDVSAIAKRAADRLRKRGTTAEEHTPK